MSIRGLLFQCASTMKIQHNLIKCKICNQCSILNEEIILVWLISIFFFFLLIMQMKKDYIISTLNLRIYALVHQLKQ
jgi:hypothetical protein